MTLGKTSILECVHIVIEVINASSAKLLFSAVLSLRSKRLCASLMSQEDNGV